MPESQTPFRNLEEHHGHKKPLGWPEFTVQNILVLILVLALIVAGLYIFKPEWFKGIGPKKVTPKSEQKAPEKSSVYSAVFLANDQVYFGRLEDALGPFPKLKEVYYLRVNRPLQPPPATAEAAPDVQLIKLGNELHGPVDEIRFNRDQILYIEDLKSDSRIVKAIEEFKSRK